MRSNLALGLLGLFLAASVSARADSIKLASSNQKITFTGLGAGDPTQLLVSLGNCGAPATPNA